MPKLKVFRTAIGFHDAYVAAPSRKAALAAWGSDKDLFARGAAEEVTDPALTAEPLTAPGMVIKRLRGTAAEQLAALPPDAPKRARPAATEEEPAVQPRKRTGRPAPRQPSPAPPPPPPPKPKPSRDSLDAAEAALAKAKRIQGDALAELAEREAALARERRSLEREGADELRRLTRQRDRAESDWEEAMRRWRL